MNPTEQSHRSQAAIVSLVVSTGLLLVKFWAFHQTGSQAVFSDAMESIVNVVASALALFVIFYASRPADQEHPYGHGKMEYFSAAFEGGLISFAAILIMVASIRSLILGPEIERLDIGVIVVLGAGAVNFLLGLYLVRRGQKLSSVALRASGKHALADFWTSLGVGLGLALVALTEMFWLDSVLAFAVGALLARSGFKLVRESVGALLDEEDLEVLKKLAGAFEKHSENGIIQIHHVKTIRSGWYHHIDAHVVLPEFWTVDQVHERMLVFEKRVIQDYPYKGEMNFHFDPCRRAYCKVCDLKDCPIRREPFVERMAPDIEQLRSPHEPSEFRAKRPEEKS